MFRNSAKIIAEIGNTHEGSLGIALSLVDMSANSGADIVKFQMHISQFESSEYEPFRNNSYIQDITRQNYWQRVSFKTSEWIIIKEYCDSKGIEFLCTPFSVEAAQILFENKLVKRWKIGSGEITNRNLINYVFNTKLEVLVSTGLASLEELDNLYEYVNKCYDVNLLVFMHCVSEYPTKLQNSSLSLIDFYRERYKTKIGHSDHSGNIATSIVALTKQIEYLEVHLKPHDLFFGADSASSLTPERLAQLVQFNRDFEIIKKSIQSRDELLNLSKETARIFRKGLYWARSMAASEIVLESDINLLKPEGDIVATEFDKFVGKQLVKDVQVGKPVQVSDFVANNGK